MSDKRILERLKDFKNAFNRLDESLNMDIQNDVMLDGIIQRFEFTFELAWKLMKDYLEESGIQEIASPKSIIKAAFKSGLVEDGEGWMDMQKDRNLTSHIYDEDIARDIYIKIKDKHISLLRDLLNRINTLLL